MGEPAIIGYGRTRIGMYDEGEYDACMRRAFSGDRPADFIVLDSSPHGQGFTSAAVAWALDAGLLYTSLRADDGQCEVANFRLTDAGRERWQGPGRNTDRNSGDGLPTGETG